MVKEQEEGQCGWSVVNGEEKDARQGEKDGQVSGYYSVMRSLWRTLSQRVM